MSQHAVTENEANDTTSTDTASSGALSSGALSSDDFFERRSEVRPEKPLRGEVPNGGRPRILAVEDEAEIRQFLSLSFTGASFDCDYARDGEAALRMYRQMRHEERPYRLLLLDMSVPCKSGIAVARELRSEDRRKDDVPVPIAFFTSDTSPLNRVRAQEVDPVAIWLKTETMGKIRQLVEDVLAAI